MAFNISEIQSAINSSGGLAKPNMFFVTITPPGGLIDGGHGFKNKAMYFCDGAQLPGINFSAAPVKSVGYGTSEQRPTDAGFSPLNTTFIVDANGDAIRFFTQWLALINNWSRDSTGVMQGSKLSYGEWNYPETYEGTVEIHCVNQVQQGGPRTSPGSGSRGGYSTNPEVVTYQLARAFPIQVGDISVAWEMNDAIMRLPVVFAYNTWNSEHVPGTTNSTVPNAPANSTGANELRTNAFAYGLTLLQNGVTPSAAAEFANLS